MPRTEIVVQNINRLGLTPTYAAPDVVNGNTFTNTGTEFLHVKNSSGGSINVTVNLYQDGTLPGRVVAVPAGTDKFIGPFNSPAYYGPSSQTTVDFSTATGVTMALLNAPKA